MRYNIEIQPSGIEYKSNENLLEDALQQSVVIEHSCKTGSCGVCSAELVQGKVENENGVEIKRGQFLACRSKALSNCVIFASYYPELIKIKEQTLPCKVKDITFIKDNIVIIRLRFPPSAKFDYLSGQYVDLSYRGVKRSYSIANAKSYSDEIELHIRKVDNGKMSQLLFNSAITTNQLMRLEGPKGTFFVRDGDKPLIMVATGTGIAPIKAMIEQLIASNDKRVVHVYWGMRYCDDVYETGLEKLLIDVNHIHLHLVFSREASGDELKTGYVQDAVMGDFGVLDSFDVYAFSNLSIIKFSLRESFFLIFHI